MLAKVEGKIRNNPQSTNQIIFESEAGKFILSRLENDVFEIARNIKINKEDLVDFDGSSLEKIVTWFLAKNDSIETELQKQETQIFVDNRVFLVQQDFCFPCCS